MGKTIRRKKEFNDYMFVESVFLEFEHNKDISKFWRECMLGKNDTVKKRYNYIHSDRFKSSNKSQSYVKKMSNKIIRVEKRNIIFKIIEGNIYFEKKSLPKRNALERIYL